MKPMMIRRTVKVQLAAGAVAATVVVVAAVIAIIEVIMEATM